MRRSAESCVSQLAISAQDIDAVTRAEGAELDRRDRLYRGTRAAAPIAGRTVILVDDGLATGATMEAAILAVRHMQPARIVVAAPVGAEETCQRLRGTADEVVCALTPEYFQAVGLWYEHFDQTSDGEVIELLRRGTEWTEDTGSHGDTEARR